MMMARKPLPIGLHSFREIVDENYYLIDKTLMIKEIVDQKDKVYLFPRPRRFGKTLNMNMLQCFFEKPISRQHNLKAEPLAYLFHDKLVWQHTELHELQGKFPVIALTFKDVKPTSWATGYEKLTNVIAEEYRSHRYLLDSDVIDVGQKKVFNNILSKEATTADFEESLKNLSIYLQKLYQTKVIILIDEYDAPIHAGYLNGFYNDVINFMRGFLCGALKDNGALQFSAITGILRTAKEGIFSGLNNLAVYSILDEQFSDRFGFTEQEVATLLADYNMTQHRDTVREWYDGYIVRRIDPVTQKQVALYNPWSVLNFVSRNAIIGMYWTNTSDNGLIKKQLTHAPSAVLKRLEAILKNQACEQYVSEGMIFPGIERNEAAIWSLLVFSGYLTTTQATWNGSRYSCLLKIPNREIALLYQELISEVMSEIPSGKFERVLISLTNGDVPLFQELFTTFFVNMMSFYDIPDDDPERSYHMFVLGLLSPLSAQYEIRSNRESGEGRYDIMLQPLDRTKLGIIIEFKKVVKAYKETLESATEIALQQVKDKNYAAEMRACGVTNILAYGIAIDGKKVLIKAEQM